MSKALTVVPNDAGPPVTPTPHQPTPNTVVIVIKRSLKALLSSLLYVLFVYTLLIQSCYTRKPIDPSKWETELMSTSWLFGIAAFMLGLAFALAAALTHGSAATAFSYCLLIFILIVDFMTLDYTSQRPELCTVKPNKGVKHKYACISTRFRFTYWRNYLGLVTITMEALQCLAIAFQRSSSFPKANTGVFRTILLQFKSETTIFAVVITFVIGYAILVGVVVELNSAPTDKLSVFLFQVAAGTGYLPITTRLLGVAVTTTSPYRSALCYIGLLFYASTAVYIGSYRGDQRRGRSDVNYVPRYLVVERMLKGLLAFTIAFASDKKYTTTTASLLILFCIAWLMAGCRCCSSKGVVRLRIIIVLACCWILVAVLLQASGFITDAMPTALIGIGVIVALSVAVFSCWSRVRRPIEAVMAYLCCRCMCGRAKPQPQPQTVGHSESQSQSVSPTTNSIAVSSEGKLVELVDVKVVHNPLQVVQPWQ